MCVDEMRGYAEWLIDCGKLGDTNKGAVCMADSWLRERHAPKAVSRTGPLVAGSEWGLHKNAAGPKSERASSGQDGSD